MKKYLFLFLAVTMLAGCSASVPGQSGKKNPDVPLDTILEKISAAYGDSYLPNTDMSNDTLKTEFGLTEDLYTEAKGVMPMNSEDVDRVVVVKAAKSKAGDVEEAFKKARGKKIEDEDKASPNHAKTNAAQVIRNEDYICFLLVGEPSKPEASKAEASKKAEADVKIGMDAFESAFK